MKNLYLNAVRTVSFMLISSFFILVRADAVHAATKTYLVDFGRSTNQTAATGWNNIILPYAGSDNPLVDSTGAASPLKLQITNGFYYESNQTTDFSINASGTTASTLYPASATMDSFFLGTVNITDTTATFVVKGLTAANTYDFRFYGSRVASDGGNRTTQYKIGTTTVELNATDNTNNYVQILNVSPTNGTITVTVTRKSGATFGYLNVLAITENSQGPANVAPTANAGTDQSVTLPTSTITLSGSGTDTDGTIASYGWTKVSGGSAAITNASAASTTVTGLAQGTYTFRLTVTDNLGATATDDVAVTVNGAANQSPTANAGIDQNVTLPIFNIILSGSGTDTDGTIASYAWTEISSGASTIASPSSASTTVTDLGPGTYTFRLTVTDNQGATASDTVTVTVNPENMGACSAQTIAVLGSSTSAGYGLNPISTSYVNRYASYIASINAANTVANFAVGGYSTYELLPTGSSTPANRPAPDPAHNITAALAQHPDGIILNLPSNDVGNGYATSETEANFQIIAAAATNAGVPIWITTTQPRDFDQAGISQQIQLRDWITATYGSKALDFWSVVANVNGTINATYGQGDGVHLNALGHQKLFNRVAEAGIMVDLCDNQQTQPNNPPTANAGTDQSVTLPTNTVTLSGSGTDSDGTIASYAWTKISGGAAAITNATAASTTVTGLVQGIYTFRLTVTDNQGATATDDMMVTVAPAPNQAPTAAGSLTSVTLSGSGTDTDGTIASYAWTKVSGGAANIATPSAATTAVTGLAQGTYVFRLTVTDNQGATATKDISFTIN